MKNFNVIINYAGSVSIQVEAENEEKARKKAEQVFDEIPDSELVAYLLDIDISDCWEEE